MKKSSKSIIAIGLVIALIVFANRCGNNQKNKNTDMEQTNNKTQEIKQVKTPEELRAEQEQQKLEKQTQQAQQLLIEQKQILNNELQFFDKPFNTYAYCKTEADMQNLLGSFGAWAALIEARENSDDTELQRLAKQLKNKVIKCQAEAFPILRQEYPKVINNKIKITVNNLGIIGGSDIEYINMQVSGNKNTRAVFTWWGLISDNNKAIFQRKIFDTLTILRFTQAKLQSDVYDSEPTYFTPFKGKDTDLITL